MSKKAREKLQLLATDIEMLIASEQRLSARHLFPPTVDFDVGKWFIAGLKRFLNGECKSLDEALDLKAKAGRPTRETIPKRALAVFLLRLQKGKTWLQIAEKFDADQRYLQREQDIYRGRIVEEISAKLNSELTAENRAGDDHGNAAPT